MWQHLSEDTASTPRAWVPYLPQVAEVEKLVLNPQQTSSCHFGKCLSVAPFMFLWTSRITAQGPGYAQQIVGNQRRFEKFNSDLFSHSWSIINWKHTVVLGYQTIEWHGDRTVNAAAQLLSGPHLHRRGCRGNIWICKRRKHRPICEMFSSPKHLGT